MMFALAEVVKNIKIATVHKLVFIILFLLSGCSASLEKLCGTKISPQLVNEINTSNETIFNVVIYLSDSTSLRIEYPFLDDISSFIATGRLTKENIRDLCKSNKITYIDLSKRRYPTNRL